MILTVAKLITELVDVSGLVHKLAWGRAAGRAMGRAKNRYDTLSV